MFEAGTARLVWSRKCFGKVRCSIAPEPKPVKRFSTIAVMRARIKTEDMPHQKSNLSRQAKEKLQSGKGALDSREKFQDGARCIAGWGKLAKRHIFSRLGQETIQEVLWIGKQKYSNKGIFLTGTVPCVDDASSLVVMSWSSWIVNRVRQTLRDRFSGAHTVVNVWENTRKGRPHFHMAVMSNDISSMNCYLQQWHDIWFEILTDLTRRTGVNVFARYVNSSQQTSLMSWYPLGSATQADAQLIVKDVARYLSKYVSKGARNESTRSAYHPASWWGVDNLTRREARQERVRLVLGGYSLDSMRVVLERSASLLSSVETQHYDFKNPVYLAYPGFVGFTEPGDDLSALAQLVKYLSENEIFFTLDAGK